MSWFIGTGLGDRRSGWILSLFRGGGSPAQLVGDAAYQEGFCRSHRRHRRSAISGEETSIGGKIMTRPGVLLDRDGTIIVDSGYVGSVDRVQFIDGAIEAIAALNRAGLPVVVVSNQAGVARGHYGIEDVQQVHKHMIAELARHGAPVDMWLFCPYHPEGIVEAFARASSTASPARAWRWLRRRPSTSTSARPGWSGTAPSTSAWPGRSAPGRCASAASRSLADPDVASFPDLAAAVKLILHRDEAGSSAAISDRPSRRASSTTRVSSAPPTPPSSTERCSSVDLARIAARRRGL